MLSGVMISIVSVHFLCSSGVLSSAVLIAFSVGLSWEILFSVKDPWASLLFFMGIVGGLSIFLTFSFMTYSLLSSSESVSEKVTVPRVLFVGSISLWASLVQNFEPFLPSKEVALGGMFSISFSSGSENSLVLSLLILLAILLVLLFSIEEVTKKTKSAL